MKTNERNHRGLTREELTVVVVVIALLVPILSPLILRSAKKSEQTAAINNLRQVGLAMFEFEFAYGSFPQNSHAQAINQQTENRFALSTIATSNDAFKQLLAAGIAGSEVMFYSKAAYSARYRPDNDYATAREMLKKGEVGFGYIMSDANTALSMEGDSGRALVVTPLKYERRFKFGKFDEIGFEFGKFDKTIHQSKALILRLDNSVSSLSIDENNEVHILGHTLFQTGPDTVWGEVATPVLKNPLPK